MGTDDDGCSSLITHRVKRRRTRGERNKIRAGLALSIKDTNVVNLSKKEKSKDKDPVNLEAFVNTINKNSNEDKIKRKQPHREPKLASTIVFAILISVISKHVNVCKDLYIFF